MYAELIQCEDTLLREIADKSLKRRSIAKTYALALASSECRTIDWSKVNAAIIARWSVSGLEWIKKQAWSGKCFEAARPAPDGCRCSHPAADHEAGYACAGQSEIAPGVTEWCQCERYSPAPAGSEEGEAR